ncbi:MAG TPA: aspartyl/glutamyl-tRNA amidotransferase subunit C [Candidatus Caccousia avicola]|uniref:Aspartyl/glutamyl-tRNA amidotransferase subunit C n=1 Tax=Candidatus Caccousia avicola TaxID=2840721 RepID=A0A9D1AMW5_9FIRM|nr:aspartyl/glutamyl-tRNA amidotransferase subunit C [Candidatus Caccousia avicola]
MDFSITEIANLANLRLTPEETEELRADFEEILQFAAQMQEPEGTAHDPEDLPFLREDVPSPSLTQEETLQNAPAMRDGCFALPRAMGGKAHA